MILADLFGRAARHELDNDSEIFYRATVLAVDLVGGMLQNENGNGTVSVTNPNGSKKSFNALIGPSNPRGSIKARVLTAGKDRFLDDADIKVFWPLLPHDQIGIPVSPGEHVYVIFEGKTHGMWLSRISGHDSAGNFLGTDSYTAPSSPRSAMDSFEVNDPEYDRTDDSAGLAPNKSALISFGEDT